MAPRGSPVARVDSSVRHVALRSVAAPPVRARSRSGYSNTNYIALGLVIEKATGHAYARELEKRILEPLGLDHTELPQTRRLPDLDDGGENPNVLCGGRRDRLERARPLPLLLRASLRAHSVQCHARDDERDS